MREFLIGLYIEHGDRYFEMWSADNVSRSPLIWGAKRDGYISYNNKVEYDILSASYKPHKLTPKAIEYIKGEFRCGNF